MQSYYKKISEWDLKHFNWWKFPPNPTLEQKKTTPQHFHADRNPETAIQLFTHMKTTQIRNSKAENSMDKKKKKEHQKGVK